ncbi:hypothetical protein BEN47_12510 [Hymenobacter lapidarius]|uniref:Nucleotide-diphospho-sugar transferase domain-containing protein n=1 Tax=Hymenobacter lapidarius TaxID=1908237 RepID=A0A1G1T6V9_9BACT|nr:hypothetical protein [Hymenobacter lapidarius]OGX86633.1 hypothetical protein BEN47_12510 [Hymenobacter lapidarius]
MPEVPCSLIYLAYGSKELHAEALYSLLSYYKVAHKAAQVLIYTDSPAAFRQVLGARNGVVYPAVSFAQWQNWRGSSNKVYLLKIGVLGHAAQHYPGNLLFVDTDTIWQADPEPLFRQVQQGKYVMHVSEDRLAAGNLLSRKVYRHLKGHVFPVGTQRYFVDERTILYNSGVIGMTFVAAERLPEVVDLADQLYATYNKHIMEQLAFSLWFGADRAVVEAAPYVVHYWNLKAARPLLARVFRQHAGQSLEEFYDRVTDLNIKELHETEMRYRSLPSWRRTLLKIVGRGWQMPGAVATEQAKF